MTKAPWDGLQRPIPYREVAGAWVRTRGGRRLEHQAVIGRGDITNIP